ncbi:DNA-directed RNA polymerase subunit B [Candidatus Micrarchaeota archaeon]|nr:DNA-directed RNA polymerase subunit B [Candidatus Micrarchaeota archaeon]
MKRKTEQSKGRTAVYVNGRLIGFHDSPKEMYKNLVERRRRKEINSQINFSYNDKIDAFYINTDRGRARRPYIIVKDGKSLYTKELQEKVKKGETTWWDLINIGVIEYLDAEEEEMIYVAIKEKDIIKEHTHLEIDPVSIMGIVAGVLPYPEHNLSVRITMACSMAKQSLGIYASNFNKRMDSIGNIMYYPQQPLAQSRPYSILNFKEKAAGQNFVVAITNHYGYNIEDSVVVNKNAIDRGLGRSLYCKTYETEERRYPGGQKDKFEIPSATTAGFREESSYAYLSDDGIISPEIVVNPGDVLVGKTSPPRFLEEISVFGIVEEKKRENSLAMRGGEQGVVDSVMISDSLGGNRMAKVRVRSVMVPQLGDKFASRHGQKGVIGMIVPQEDLPFTKDGIVPDLLLNPLALPSRKTMGHIIETIVGKAACFEGKIMDSTAFDEFNQEEFEKMLEEYGFDKYGEEILYDGITGRKIKSTIFIGVVYYQRLKHLVANKIHARSRGPVQLLTHQPTEGRAREGGLRLGEMERDCLVGYGASMLIKERLLEESDKTTLLICAKCGSVAVHDHIKNKDTCPLCDSTQMFEVELSYAFKLLLDEIKALGIFPRLKLKDKA